MQTQETKAAPAWDEVSFVIAYENGELDDDDIVDGFQHLVDNGHAWTLQGAYGRMANRLIQAGLVRTSPGARA